MNSDKKCKIKRICLTGSSTNSFAKKIAKITLSALQNVGIECIVAKEFKLKRSSIPLANINADMVFSFGGDGTLLHTVRELKKQIPIVGINCGTFGHLTEINADRIHIAVDEICNGNYFIERRSRLQGNIDGTCTPQALNEIAIAPLKSMQIMKYAIYLDNELLMKDIADCLIIATPTGSTAHALSAGGPQIMNNVNAFVIVPVNSLDKNKRPIVVNDNAEIVVTELASKDKIEAVIDGHVHTPVKEKITIKKGTDALFVRLKRKQIVKPLPQFEKLTPSARFIYEVLTHHGILTQKEIKKETLLPLRTISRSLQQLKSKGLIVEKKFLTNEKVKGYLVR